MKYSKTVQLSTFLAATVLLSAVDVPHAPASTSSLETSALESSPSSTLISQTDSDFLQQDPAALDAYVGSEYGYWDAVLLADYWGTSLYESKANIGRKVLDGGENLENLEGTLGDAQAQALESVEDLRYYQQFVEERAGRFTYDNVVDLANYWGLPNAYEAKLRIERKLITGNIDSLENAMLQVL